MARRLHSSPFALREIAWLISLCFGSMLSAQAQSIVTTAVKRAPARFTLASGNTGRDSNAGFNIRGMDGSRVLLLSDGIRIPRRV